MKKNIPDIDKIFKDALDDLHEAAPPAVWESLTHDLDKKQAAHFREKYYRLKRMALLLLMLVFSSGIYMIYFSKIHKKDVQVSAKDTSVTSTVKTNTAEKPSTTSAAQTGKNISSESSPDTKDMALPADLKSKPESLADRKNKIEIEGNIVVGESLQNINPEKKNALQAETKSIKQMASSNDATGKSNTGIQSEPENMQYNQRVAATGTKNIDPVSQTNLRNKRNEWVSGNMQIAGKVTADGTGTKARLVKSENNTLTRNKPVYITALSGQNVSAADASPSLITKSPRLSSSLSGSIYLPPLDLSVIEPISGQSFQPLYSFVPDTAENDPRLKTDGKKIAKKTGVKHGLSLIAFGAPNHSFMRLEDDNRLAGRGYDKNEAMRSEQQGGSYSAGVLVNYGLTQHLIIQSGIVFSSATTNIAGKTIYAKSDNTGHARYEFNCSSGYSYINAKTGPAPTVGDSIHIMGSSSSISYIGIPVSFNYAVYGGRFSFIPGIGFSVNFLTNGNSATSFRNTAGNQKETAPIDGLKTAYMDASFGLGLEYKLNKRISVSLRPLMRLALTSINKNTPVRSYQNFVSMETGLKINL